MSAYSCSARAWSSRQSSAITSSQVSAPVTHGFVSTQRMPSPGITKSSQRESIRSMPGLAADGAAEDGVVPVHRERRLVEEQVAVLAQRVAEAATGELPLRLRVVHQLGERHPGAQRLVDARRPGEQGVAVHLRRPVVVPLLRPGDAAEGQLHPDHEVQPTSYDGPHPLDERQVAPQHPVVPDADGEVRRHVGLAAGVLDLAGDDLHRPGAVVALVCAGTSRTPPPPPSTSPATISAIAASTWFQTSTCSPTVHGTAPSASCIDDDGGGGLGDLRAASARPAPTGSGGAGHGSVGVSGLRR